MPTNTRRSLRNRKSSNENIRRAGEMSSDNERDDDEEEKEEKKEGNEDEEKQEGKEQGEDEEHENESSDDDVPINKLKRRSNEDESKDEDESEEEDESDEENAPQEPFDPNKMDAYIFKKAREQDEIEKYGVEVAKQRRAAARAARGRKRRARVFQKEGKKDQAVRVKDERGKKAKMSSVASPPAQRDVNAAGTPEAPIKLLGEELSDDEANNNKKKAAVTHVCVCQRVEMLEKRVKTLQQELDQFGVALRNMKKDNVERMKELLDNLDKKMESK